MYTNTSAAPRRDLAISVQKYSESKQGLIASRLFPIYKVPAKKGQFPVHDITAILQRAASVARTKITGTPLLSGKVNWENYECAESILGEAVLDEDVAFFQDFFSAEEAAAKRVQNAMDIEYEYEAASMLNTTNFGTGYNTAATAYWTNTTNAVPMTDAANAIAGIKSKSGLVPDTAVMSWTIRRALGRNKQIKDLLLPTNSVVAQQDLPDAIIAEALGVRQILVGDAPYTSSQENATTPTIGNIWGDTSVLFCKVSSGNDLRADEAAGLGRTLVWTGLFPELFHADSFRNEDMTADIVRLRSYRLVRLMNKEAGHLITGTAA